MLTKGRWQDVLDDGEPRPGDRRSRGWGLTWVSTMAVREATRFDLEYGMGGLS
jgi:hypothetical protein